jgi:hypothetical protein
MSNVAELEVHFHRISNSEANRGLGAILDAVSRSSVTRLNLSNNGMDDVSGSFENALPLSRLTELDFSFNRLSVPCARSLLTGLASCSTMQRLVLRQCAPFPSEAVKTVAEMLSRTSLKFLALTVHISCAETLMPVLAQGLQGSTITELDLSRTLMPAASLEILMGMLRETQVAALNLCENFREVEAARVLGKKLPNTRLKRVDFRYNPLDTLAVEALIEAAQKSTITDLKIDYPAPPAQAAWVRLMALLADKRRSDFVLQLHLHDQGSGAEDFTVRAHKMSGEIAATVRCPRAILCGALFCLLLTELTANGRLPAERTTLKLLLPNGRVLNPSSELLLEQFEAETRTAEPPAKKSRAT